MPMTSLAAQADATAYGYGTIAAGYFARASARVRLFATSRGYSLDDGTFTVVGRGPSVQLPNRPVLTITSVTDVEDTSNTTLLTTDEWVLRSGGVLEAPAYSGNLSIVYTAGTATLSDGMVEFVCAVASRMANTLAAVGSGAQQETGGSESVTYGFDSYSGISDLTKGELASLSRMFPPTPGLIVMRAGAPGPGVPSQTRFSLG
jgi:hypothetical protein